MDIVIKSILETLKKSESLLINLTDDVFSDSSVSPYYSSIGSHIRHILDFYECILDINSVNEVNLINRSRNIEVETKCASAKNHLILT